MMRMQRYRIRLRRVCLIILSLFQTFISHEVNITPQNTTEEIQKFFACAPRGYPIGPYNEYYQECIVDTTNLTALRLVNVSIVAQRDLRIRMGIFHVEIKILSASRRLVIDFLNSSVTASAISISAENFTIDAGSHVNTNMKGLKYGPGYNAWRGMGASYGGTGGLTLQEPDCPARGKPGSENRFVKLIGSVDASDSETLDEFRGYGSGGGTSDSVRGGGRINITASNTLTLDGKLSSDGGSCAKDSRGAGSGGTIIIHANSFLETSTSGLISASGGNAIEFSEQALLDTGGGGAGGGGRVVVHTVVKNTFDPSRIKVVGGKGSTLKNSTTVVECQRGAAGTLYLVTGASNNSTKGSLWIQGQSPLTSALPSNNPFATTPLLFEEQQYNSPIPPELVSIRVSGGAIVTATSIVLPKEVRRTWTEILIEEHCQLLSLYTTQSITVSAALIQLSGSIGTRPSVVVVTSDLVWDPYTRPDDNDENLPDISIDATQFALKDGSIFGKSISVTSSQEVMMDAPSLMYFSESVSIQALFRISLAGFIRPSSHPTSFFTKSPSLVNVTCLGNSEIGLQSLETAALDLVVVSGNSSTVDIPPQSPYKTLRVSGSEVKLLGAHSGTSNPASLCKPQDTTEYACRNAGYYSKSSNTNVRSTSEYPLVIFASDTVQITNVSTSAMLVCSPKTQIHGLVSAQGLGCASGAGPGNSSTGGERASGGAGHASLGGNVLRSDDTDAVQDILGTGGRPYDELKHPTWPGSGASRDVTGQIIGGAGGGVITIQSNLLEMQNGSVLSVAGADGLHGGGGGAGGTLVLSVETLTGNATLDIRGGCACDIACTLCNNTCSTCEGDSQYSPSTPVVFGGGGSGGFLHLLFENATTGGAPFLTEGGKLLLDGGLSAGRLGGNGAATPNVCKKIGYGGVFCLPCVPGYYSPNVSSDCLACQAGSYNGASGSASCTKCPVGQITKKVGQSNCTLCPIGQTTYSTNHTVCTDCTYKPRHARYNSLGDCGYKCDSGRNGVDCLTPFERLVKPIGGPLGFFISILGAMLLIFTTWGITSRRNAPRDLEKWYRKHRGELQEAEAALKKQSSHYEKWKRHETIKELWRVSNFTPRLNIVDLKGHIDRIYLLGSNTLQDPWTLSNIPTKKLEPHVFSGSYESFVSDCNSLISWNSTWERLLLKSCVVLCPPLFPTLLAALQRRRVRALSAFVSGTKGSFFRNLDLQMQGCITLKLGYSPCLHMAYIDVVYTSDNDDDDVTDRSLDFTPGVFKCPITLMISGDGTFSSPFMMDTNDIYLRSLPSNVQALADDAWVALMAALNLKLSQVCFDWYYNSNSLEALEELLSEFNSQDHLIGLEVRLGVFGSSSSIKDDCVDFLSISDWKLNLSHREQVRAGQRMKLALCVDQSSGVLPEEQTAAVVEPKRPVTSLDNDAASSLNSSTSETIFSASKIRQEALYGLDIVSHCDDEYDDDDTEDEDDNTQPLLLPSPAKRKSRLNVNWLCSPLMRYISLRNNYFHDPQQSKLSAYRPALILGLILVDSLTVFVLLADIWCIQVEDPTAGRTSGCSRFSIITVMSVYPAALLVSPVIGISFLWRRRGYVGRMFAIWTVASMLNLSISWVCALLYYTYLGPDAIVLSTVGLVLKHLQKTLTVECVAQFEAERPLRGWRGLHSTTEYYDSSTDPNVKV